MIEDEAAIVAESFGRALTQLVTRRQGKEPKALTRLQGASHARPRFVRGDADEAGRRVIAVSDDNKLALFDVAEGDKAPPAILGAAQGGPALVVVGGYPRIRLCPGTGSGIRSVRLMGFPCYSTAPNQSGLVPCL